MPLQWNQHGGTPEGSSISARKGEQIVSKDSTNPARREGDAGRGTVLLQRRTQQNTSGLNSVEWSGSVSDQE